jgi:hypothetical protein
LRVTPHDDREDDTMPTDFLGRELPEEQPTAQTVEEFAVEQGTLQPEDLEPQDSGDTGEGPGK